MENLKKYLVTFDEQDLQEFNITDMADIISEQFNGIKTKEEQRDILKEIEEFEIGDAYEHYNKYKRVTDIRVRRI